MSLFEFLLFVHIIATIVWIGTAIALQIIGGRFARAADPVASAAFGRHTADIGEKVFMPASVIVLASGIWMVLDSGWEFDDPFIAVGIAAVILSTVIGAAVIGPQAAKLGAVLREKGPGAPEIGPMTKKFILSARINLLVLIGAVFFMTVKPFS